MQNLFHKKTMQKQSDKQKTKTKLAKETSKTSKTLLCLSNLHDKYCYY